MTQPPREVTASRGEINGLIGEGNGERVRPCILRITIRAELGSAWGSVGVVSASGRTVRVVMGRVS